MKQAHFLLVTAAIGTVFGVMTLFFPDKAAETFGLTANGENSIVFGWLGAITLCSSVLFFMVRNDKNSNTLKSVIIFIGAFHALTLIVDIVGISQGVLTINKVIPGIILHSLMTIGSIVFVLRFKLSND
ncbi:MAG: DUF1129 domain-containing protein [Cyclobacteriaceae bacterium]|nr:DUF1129 domain-containing protein [Cyclobacteriaceae bacterium]